MTANLPNATITKAAALATTSVLVNRARLYCALRAVEEFMSQDETRFHLCATYVEISSSALTVVATDGHTLARATIPCAVEGALSGGFLVRSPSIKAAIKMLKCTRAASKENVTLTFGGVSGTLHLDGATCSLWIVDATFPPYRQVIPDYTSANRRTDGKVGVDPSYLGRACEAVTRFGRHAGSVSGAVVTLGGNELDPALVEFSDGELGSLTIVIMPMRLK